VCSNPLARISEAATLERQLRRSAPRSAYRWNVRQSGAELTAGCALRPVGAEIASPGLRMSMSVTAFCHQAVESAMLVRGAG
jgi:hypothetical protein